MKPDRHYIPLTLGEREFVSAMLAVAIARGFEHVIPAAIVIESSQPRADRLIEVSLSDTDRECVHGIMCSDRIPGVTYPQGRTVGPAVVGELLAVGDYSVVSRMFDDYVLDERAVERLLTQPRAPFCDFKVLPDYVRNPLFRQSYCQTKLGQINDSVQKALDFCRAACLCKVHRQPPTSRAKYGRLTIEWAAEMYKPPASRRPPLREPSGQLTAVDEKALAEIA